MQKIIVKLDEKIQIFYSKRLFYFILGVAQATSY